MGSEEEERDGTSVVYKMKVVQTLGRSVPIILQNDNGPCPLLAISNVLLLRNNVTLNLDMSEVSQRELMSLVAEWLLDANSNVQNQTDEYVKNQQQHIDDAISLLPRLATGIDVNVCFRHIHDFEFTRECAIFDLFHVGLVHGWLCDPQDEITSTIIGANSYNTLVEKLVAFHALKAEKEASDRVLAEQEPTVDLAAATNATLGVPRPILLKNLSNVSSVSNVSSEYLEPFRQDCEKPRRKGDDEEAAELLQALQLSQAGLETVIVADRSSSGQSSTSPMTSSKLATSLPDEQGRSTPDAVSSLPLTTKSDPVSEDKVDSEETVREVMEDEADKSVPSVIEEPAFENELSRFQPLVKPEDRETSRAEALRPVSRELSMDELSLQSIQAESSVQDGARPVSPDIESSISVGEGNTSTPVHADRYARSPSSESNVSIFTVGEDVKTAVDPLDLDSDVDVDAMDNQHQSRLSPSESMSPRNYKPASESSSGHLLEESECASSGIDDEEPLYEGELILTGSGVTNTGEKVPVYDGVNITQDKEPMYEGEVVLAEQVLGGNGSPAVERRNSENLKEERTRNAIREGVVIEKFLNDTASQLTYHGLFSLQEGLKENELYVFFRNNHFSTIFKHEGQIYLLATDQGYLNQPDLVWEKLSEVDGNSSFYTGNFQLFEVDQSSGSWNEQEAVAATAEYMSSHHGTVGGAGASYDADYQLAMHLQQQELAQQQQQQQQQQQLRSPSPANQRVGQQNPKSPSLGATRLVTGPPRSSVPPPKAEKAKEKCTIM